MSKYKRLTKQKWSKDIDLTQELGYSYIYKRLHELEDKIENGTLIELPCKVGDTVWWVNGYCTVPRIEEYTILALTIAKDNKIYLRVEYGHFTFEVDELCFTKEQAEAKLKELQEEKNDKERVY